MTRIIGTAGRQALNLAQHVAGARRIEPVPSSTLSSAHNGIPSLMRQAADAPPEQNNDNAPAPARADTAASEIERETPSLSPQDVAERVYHIFCENLRRERERRGYWD